MVDNLQDVDEESEKTKSLNETLKEFIEKTVLQSEQQMSPPSYKDQKQTIQPLLTQPLKKGDSW